MGKREINVGEIGGNFRKFTKLNFDSHESLLDYDVVFLDINHISAIIYDPSNFIDPYSSEEVWVGESKRKLIEKRAAEFKEYVKEGRTLVIFLPKPQEYKFFKGHHATGEFLNTIFSPRYLLLESIEGSRMDIVPNTKFSKLLKKYENIFRYKSSFQEKAIIGKPLLKIKGTERVVSSFDNNLLLFPAFNFRNSGDDAVDLFGDELLEILNPTTSAFTLPDWANNYLLPSEKIFQDERTMQLSKLKEIENEIANIDKKINDLNRLKVLITGTGQELEEAVSTIFKNLGFTILQTDYNRDDLIVQYDEQIAVIEVKGISKSAAEEHATQLEKWVTEYSLEKGKHPKGILIVNSFREIELSNRNVQTFPDQMKKFSTKRDHCLITSVQLLGLYYDCLNKPAEKDLIIASLFNTIGEFPNYRDWKEFINFNKN